ncbi:MAG: hypothetical protein JSW73_01815 [Candidatus Woesearchaeota archaeon]|nr:MAG: hypothetical protein JSW73_01815 [Candidatus Woesearchaeota archaeon]
MKTEIKRQSVHFLGILLGLFIVYQGFYDSLRLLAGLVFATLLFNWYYGKRHDRRASFKDTINDSWIISKTKREEIVKSADKFYEFEEKLFEKILDKTGLRDREEDPTIPPLYFFISSLICLIFLGREITVLVIITLAVGDSLSAIVGKKYGKHKIHWSKKKSYEGTIAFFIFVFIAIYIFISFLPEFAIFHPITLSLSAALFGALIETEPTLTDNFSIPVFTGVILYLIAYLI